MRYAVVLVMAVFLAGCSRRQIRYNTKYQHNELWQTEGAFKVKPKAKRHNYN